ncbi:MAG: YdbL family protein [Pseudomonadales bacterium]
MGRVADIVKASLIILLLGLSSHALAMDLNAAKGAGLVGETAEGYLDLVNPAAPSEVVALVQEVNARRRAEYQRIAEQNRIGLEEVEALAARKAIEKTRPGGWIRINDQWRQK